VKAQEFLDHLPHDSFDLMMIIVVVLILLSIVPFFAVWKFFFGGAAWPVWLLLTATFGFSLALGAKGNGGERCHLIGTDLAVLGIALLWEWASRSPRSGGGIIGWWLYGLLPGSSGATLAPVFGLVLVLLGSLSWIMTVPEARSEVQRILAPLLEAMPMRRRGEEPSPELEKPRPEAEHLLELPPITLLQEDQGELMSERDAREMARVIEETLASFKVPARVVSIRRGPAVTQFGLEPGVIKSKHGNEERSRKVRVRQIKALQNDIALELAAESIRIETPVPGKNFVGIEVPNPKRMVVSLRGVLESEEFARQSSPLAVALGRGVSGEPLALDIARLPHLLIAGATGSGKSVSLNAILISLLMRNTPDRVQFLLVDPKRVELQIYNGVPHLVSPVIVEPDEAAKALKWAIMEMDDRYRMFVDAGVRDIEVYNKATPSEPMPYVVIVIDELADLMLARPEEIEHGLVVLAQKSRATGIHLVVATQRPSVDVVTGLIKANFPARIAFNVSTSVDSRVILDQPGAEKLLGRGDGLLLLPWLSKLVRFKGCFVSDEEAEAVTDFWRAQAAERQIEGEEAESPWSDISLQEEEGTDERLIEEAIRMLQGHTTTSTSWLQRKLRLGFPRAARLMEELEARGIVGPDEGAGRGRKVLIGKDPPASQG
jgi:S-DNA-T family DNA segregation ATPase FtsK/SpoIIIE